MSASPDFVQIKRKRKRPPPRVSVDPCLGFYLTGQDVEPMQDGSPDICASLKSPAGIYSEDRTLPSAFDQEPGFARVASPLPAIATLEDIEAQPSQGGGSESPPRDDTAEYDMHRSPCLGESLESFSATSSLGFGTASILREHRVIEHIRPRDQAVCTPVTTTARIRRYHARRRRLRGTELSSQSRDSPNETIDMDSGSSSETHYAKRPRTSWNSASLRKVQQRRPSISKKNKRRKSPSHQDKSFAQSMLTAAVLSHVDLPSQYLADCHLHRRPLKFTTDLESISTSPTQRIGPKNRPFTSFRRPAFRSSEFMYKRDSSSVKKVSMPMSYWSVRLPIESTEERAAGNYSSTKDNDQVQSSGPSARVPLQFLPIGNDPGSQSRRDTRHAGRRKLPLSSVSVPRSAFIRFSPLANLKDVPMASDVGPEATVIKGIGTDEGGSRPIIDPIPAPLSRAVVNQRHQLDPLQHDTNTTEPNMPENALLAEAACPANLRALANGKDSTTEGPSASVLPSPRQAAVPPSPVPHNVPMPSTSKQLKPLASFFEEFMRTARALNETESPPKVQGRKRVGRKRARRTDFCD